MKHETTKKILETSSRLYPIKKDLIREAWSYLNGEAKKILSQMSKDKHPLVGIYAAQKKGMEEWLKVYDSKLRPELPYIYTMALQNALYILKNFNEFDFSKKVFYHSWCREYDDPKGMVDSGLIDEMPAPYEVYNNSIYNIQINLSGYKDCICTYAEKFPKMVEITCVIETSDYREREVYLEYDANKFPTVNSFLKWYKNNYLSKGERIYEGCR